MTCCPDCGVPPGQPHQDGCDVARCLQCGFQRLMCLAGMSHPVPALDEHDGVFRDQGGRWWKPGPPCDPGEDIWTGEWPGTAECREYGLWCRHLPGGPLEPCGPDDLGAVPAVSRLIRNGIWDRDAVRWVLLDGAPLL